MKRFIVAMSLVASLVLATAGLQKAAAQVVTDLPPSVSFDQSGDLQAIRLRLEQQDEELRQLRERLSLMQNDVHLPPAVSQFSPSGDVIPAGAIATPALFQLQDRMTAMEQRLDEKSSDSAAKTESAPKGYEVGSDLKMAANWKNGVNVQSANKDFRLHVGGKMQFDVCMFDNDPALLVSPAVGGIGPQPDSLDLRRVILKLDGTMYETFDWVMEWEFANFVSVPTPNVQTPASTNPGFKDMYLTWTKLPTVGNFRVGSFKEPIGFEHLESDTYLDFMERSYLQDFVFGPFNGGYTPGLMFYNWTQAENATWWLGFFGANDDNFGYSLGNDYAVTGRLSWCPYYDEPTDGRYVVHFGVAGSSRAADENLVRLRVRGDIRSGPPGVLNPIYADTGNIGASMQNIAAFESAFVFGSFSVVGEYVGTWLDDAIQPITPVPVGRGTPYFHGGYIQCGYFLTGEHEVYDRHRGTFDRVTPYGNAFCVSTCDGHCKGWGAWQVVARYNTLDLNDNGINGGMLNSFTFGVQWFWNANARVQMNYDFTNRSRVKTVAQGDINSLGVRFSYDF